MLECEGKWTGKPAFCHQVYEASARAIFDCTVLYTKACIADILFHHQDCLDGLRSPAAAAISALVRKARVTALEC
jgi:hypothetical protein